MLADQGAEVIKVEPITGELVRHMAAPHNGVNPVFFSCNRGKKSIALRARLQPTEATLTDQDIEAASQKIIQKVLKATGGDLRE